ncbi:sugar phosphate isomerase/epimerase [Kitasatospora sp. YST-16]|uniref:sugar phosphate isomerase/epimerase family protein n=1 Tax=unclassified Kitasatospora TaxID=2633591 RepID=UPI0004C342E9|nr:MULTISPECIES: sugar phosphate isomerase/epimerase family protein [unclassified Kitasatospora]WAL74769.1 sugar phosphate isomerase/epimerase [Kitasatospora sp. YST-16]WNW40823.1 sugar phosphate isomerase/epimerase family protein [Streptomyces sp. Li-HN-5-13]
MTGPDRLSLNQVTTKRWSLPEAVQGCVDAGIPAIGLWRDKVAETGVAEAAKLVRDAGLAVSTLCRGGFLTAPGPDGRRAALAENLRALEEAAELGTDTLVLVVGGLPDGSRDLPGARARVAELLAELAPHAGDFGVRLAIEPLHPMFCADRAVVSTLGQALDLAELFPADQVGVVVDSYHVWWDPELERQVARAGAGGRIASYQVCDWTLPLPADALLGRGHVGDGHIDFRALTGLVTAAGYTGWIEVEIFNEQVWDTPGADTLRTVVERHRAHLERA